MDMLEIWNQVLENLEGNVSPVGFNIHIKTAVPVCFENSTFTISVATSINKNLVEYRYKKYIESSLEKVTGAKISLAVLVGDAKKLLRYGCKQQLWISRWHCAGKYFLQDRLQD